MSGDKKVKAIEGEVVTTLELQNQVTQLERELMDNPVFNKFVTLRASLNDKYEQLRKDAEAVLVPAYQAGEIDKTLKGDWGTITITESDQFEIDDTLLPAKFWKKVPDTTKIRKTYQLEGKEPKGTKQTKRYGIMMRFKNGQEG